MNTTDESNAAAEENHPLPSERQIQELAVDQLEEALHTDQPREKDYHIRTALQALEGSVFT